MNFNIFAAQEAESLKESYFYTRHCWERELFFICLKCLRWHVVLLIKLNQVVLFPTPSQFPRNPLRHESMIASHYNAGFLTEDTFY